MKVDKNLPIDACAEQLPSGLCVAIPLRLEIAARIIAALFANSNETFNVTPHEALRVADDLIAAHNETCGAEAK